MYNDCNYLIGVDGGGSGTRVSLCRRDGSLISQAEGGPSALSRGIDAAWKEILSTLERAFFHAGESQPKLSQCAIGLGLAGVHNTQWAQHFRSAAPAFAALRLATDGFTTLLGAHDGNPGIIVALGTGSIAEALYPDGSHREVSGWGYPCGDEASGAWLGQRAMQRAQMALDGRQSHSPLTRSVLEFAGGSWQAMMEWNGAANASRYAQLAPLVLRAAASDPYAAALLTQAGQDAWAMARAMDPEGKLPVALCGGLGQALSDWLPAEFRARLVSAKGDSARGALLLLQR